jgi:hypothetical protein
MAAGIRAQVVQDRRGEPVRLGREDGGLSVGQGAALGQEAELACGNGLRLAGSRGLTQ